MITEMGSNARPIRDLAHLTLRNKVRAKLTEADQLEKDADNVATELLKEILRAKARGIRGTVWDLAEEEYKEFYGEQDPTLEFEDPAKGVGEGDI